MKITKKIPGMITMVELAEKYNLKYNTVYRRIERAGLAWIQKVHGAKFYNKVKAIKAMEAITKPVNETVKKSEATLRQLADQFECSPRLVGRILKQAGIVFSRELKQTYIFCKKDAVKALKAFIGTEKYISISETALMYDESYGAIHYLITKHKLKPLKKGRTLFYSRIKVQEMMALHPRMVYY